MNSPDSPSNNPYAPPSADPRTPVTSPSPGNYQLASRWARLGASIIDSIISVLVLLPVLFLLGFFAVIDPSWTVGFNIFAALGVENEVIIEIVSAFIGFILGLAVYWFIQGFFIRKSSQTIGKKALDIVITDLDGRPADFKTIVVKRAVFYLGVSAIPFVGRLASLINVCLIFGQEKRCGHDLHAGTVVVTAASIS